MNVTAIDIMSKPVISVRTVTTVRELMALLNENRISGVPVLSEDGELAGVVSITDLLAANLRDDDSPEVTPDFHTSPAMDGLSEINSLLEPDDEILEHSVSELMSPNAITTTEGSTVAELSKAMVSQRIHRLLVVREKEVVGIVSVGDILRAIAEQTK